MSVMGGCGYRVLEILLDQQTKMLRDCIVFTETFHEFPKLAFREFRTNRDDVRTGQLSHGHTVYRYSYLSITNFLCIDNHVGSRMFSLYNVKTPQLTHVHACLFCETHPDARTFAK